MKAHPSYPTDFLPPVPSLIGSTDDPTMPDSSGTSPRSLRYGQRGLPVAYPPQGTPSEKTAPRVLHVRPISPTQRGMPFAYPPQGQGYSPQGRDGSVRSGPGALYRHGSGQYLSQQQMTVSPLQQDIPVPVAYSQDYPPQSYPPRDYPPRSYPQRDYPPQSFPQRDYPPQSYPPQAYPQGWTDHQKSRPTVLHGQEGPYQEQMGDVPHAPTAGYAEHRQNRPKTPPFNHQKKPVPVAPLFSHQGPPRYYDGSGVFYHDPMFGAPHSRPHNFAVVVPVTHSHADDDCCKGLCNNGGCCKNSGCNNSSCLDDLCKCGDQNGG